MAYRDQARMRGDQRFHKPGDRSSGDGIRVTVDRPVEEVRFGKWDKEEESRSRSHSPAPKRAFPSTTAFMPRSTLIHQKRSEEKRKQAVGATTTAPVPPHKIPPKSAKPQPSRIPATERLGPKVQPEVRYFCMALL